jgi:hypothetical protein
MRAVSYITRFAANIVTAGSSPWCDNGTRRKKKRAIKR